MSGDVLVAVQPNILDPGSAQRREIPWRPGLTPGQIEIDDFPIPEGLDVAVSVNGRLLNEFELVAWALSPGDGVLVKVVPHGGGGGGGGGKNPIAAVASIALMIAVPAASGAWGAQLGGMMSGSGMLGGMSMSSAIGLGKAIVGGVVALGGRMLVNAVTPTPPATSAEVASIGSSGFEDSSTYGLGQAGNPSRNGHVVPLPMGECHNVMPFLLTSYVSIEGTERMLNVLCLLGEEIDAVDGVFDLKLDGSAIDTLEGASWVWRSGTQNQTVIPWFNDGIFEKAVVQELSAEAWVTVATDGDAVRGLGVGLACQLMKVSGNDIVTASVSVELQYRVADGEWTSWGTYTISGASRSRFPWFKRLDGLTAAAYEIRARFASAPPSSAEYVAEIYFDYLQEIVPDDFRFPNSALLAFRMPHPGHMPEVSCGVRRTLAPVWNPSTEAWEDKPLNNLAWMAWHVTHSRRGARVHESRILYDDFELAADWCDQKGITGSLYLDSAMDARTVWDHLGTLGRFRVVRKGTSIGVISDRPVDAPEQGLLSTDANSHVSSFGLGYLKSQDRADAVRITYFDKVKGRTTIQVLGEHYHNITNRSPVVRDMTMPVCDDNGVAVRAGRYWLRCNRYLVRTLSRTMRIEAIGCLPGHVIQVASDVAEWGISSRIKAVSETTVTLGRTVTLEPGLIYKIKVKHTDRLSIDGPGELHEERTIVGVAETTITDTLTLAEPWADAPGQPALDVVVSFGEADRYLRLYRVTRITRSSRHLRTIEALEYAPEIYEDEGEVPAPDPAATVVAVAGLQAAILDRLEDGLQKKVVQLLWHGRALKWYVFVRRIGDISWTRLGDTSSPTFNARNLEVGHYYDFVVSGTTNPGDGEAVTVDFTLGVLSGLIQQVSEYVGDVEELLFENVGGAVMAVQEVM